MEITHIKKSYVNLFCNFILNFSESKCIKTQIKELSKAINENSQFRFDYIAIAGFGDIGVPKFHGFYEYPISIDGIVKDIEHEALETANLIVL